MSYILEALRKAEADRKLGESVSLHDPAPMASTHEPSMPADSSVRRWPLAGLVALLVLGLALVWLLWPDHSATTPSPSADQNPQAPSAQAVPTPDMPETRGTPAAVATVTDPRPTVVQIPQPKVVRQPSNPTPPAPVTAQAKEADEPRLIDDATRATLPPLAVGGAMYADVPSQRMVVINGQVFREGDTVAPGLVLERIQLKSAVLQYQGQRYLLTY